MSNARLVATAAAIVLTGALGACATPGAYNQPGPYAGKYNHQRDAKQGYASSAVPSQAPAPRLLHDHREMK